MPTKTALHFSDIANGRDDPPGVPAEHTPTPWFIKHPCSPGKDYDCEDVSIRSDERGQLVTKVRRRFPNDEGDAAFIVRAVNNHDDLVLIAEKLLYFTTQDRKPMGIELDFVRDTLARAKGEKAR